MDNKAIKLLYIDSKVNALVEINQAPAGQTGSGAITQPIAAGSAFFITMLPLENAHNFVYVPYTRRISTAGSGSIEKNDGLVHLCMWPENIVELTLFPLTVFKNEEFEIKPDVLTPFEFYISGERHTAFIYNEAISSFAVEQTTTNRLRFISPLPFRASSADISFVKFGDFPVIYATGKTDEQKSFIYAATILPEFHTAVCTVCDSYDIGSSSISVVKDGPYRQELIRYERDGSRLVPVRSELGWFTKQAPQPADPELVCADLLEAIHAGDKNAALDCLTSSLADGLSFADLKEFFGNFAYHTQPLSPADGESRIALKYEVSENIYTARVFCVDTQQTNNGLRIDNIREP